MSGAPKPRVRPPRPLPRPVRVGLAVAAVLVLVAGALLLRSAEQADGGRFAGDAWLDEPQPPRSGDIEEFDDAGALRGWTVDDGGWEVVDGELRATDGGGDGGGSGTDGARTAIVDVGTDDFVVFARVVEAGEGSGLVLGRSDDGTLLELVAGRPGRWVVRSAGAVVAGLDAPTEMATVEVVRRANVLEITVDDQAQEVRLPPEPTFAATAGVIGRGQGLRLDLFATLALPGLPG